MSLTSDAVPQPLRGLLGEPVRQLSGGDVLFREGEPADHFFVVESGIFEIVRRVKGHALQVSTFGPGEFGGEAPLLSGTPHLATGRATTDVMLRTLDAEGFWRLLQSCKDARELVLANMAVRLSELQQTSLEREVLVALGRVTSGVAHELLNPLNLVLGFADLAHDHIVDRGADLEAADLEDVLRDLDLVRQHGQRAADTVQRMRSHVNALAAPRGAVDIATLVNGVVSAVDAGDVEVGVRVDPGLPVIEASGSALESVLTGLIENAIHAVRQRRDVSRLDPGRVDVRVREAVEAVQIEVEDNGVGLPDDLARHVFEPFFTTRAGAAGSGLGLAVAYDVVTAAHGGSIRFDSREGEGSVVTIRLPLPEGDRSGEDRGDPHSAADAATSIE